MSVAAQSPFVGRLKRQFEPTDCSPTSSFGSAKRHRGSPSGRCSPAGGSPAYAVSSWTLTALRKLFPGVDEKVMRDTLEACDNDVDATIKRLNVLCLSSGPRQTSPTRPGASSSYTDGAGLHPSAEHEVASSGTPKPVEDGGTKVPETPEQWIEALVAEMGQAKSLDDARQRAGNVLQAFEKAVLTGAQGKLVEELRAQVEALTKDNGILKRGVAIQNSRLQDLVSKEDELTTLRTTLQQYQEKLHSLQMSNYSLAMHLRQATEPGRFIPGQHNPDVF